MFLLANRASRLTEKMDMADCHPDRLARTYRHFALINTAVSGWSVLYRRYLRPALAASDRPARILDIGCGGGDVLRRLTLRARRDGFSVTALGIDPDDRAVAVACQSNTPPGIDFRVTDARSLAQTGERFTIVLSNHVLHHLPEESVPGFLETSRQLSTGLVLHNDIRRHILAYLGFPLIGGLFHDSYILTDGLRSIRRSFTPNELRAIVPPGWEVRTAHPFRCVVIGAAGTGETV
ncbi:MAG: methyltransferase domain-containing protein [Capsulimonadales bacterium]|nr:methyltransferase domain-containing protein [Capsulimonadales bacterium]